MQTDYVVVEAPSFAELTDAVKELMSAGWICQGGVALGAIDEDTDSDWCYQAMVRQD